MTDTDIRTALEQATGELRTPPDLLDRVRAGGQRRVVRRRTLLAAGFATIAGGSTAGALLAGTGGGETPVAAPLLDRPTRGDLKRDAAFLKRVRAAWRDHIGDAAVLGEPHIAWAGSAPHGGRIAVVAQRAPLRKVQPSGQTSSGPTGFVEEDAAGIRVISAEEMLDVTAPAPAVILGRRNNVLMVFDDGRRIRYSPEPSYTAEGKVHRTFVPLDFRAHDGVAFVATAPQPTLIRVGLRADVANGGGDRRVGLANLSRLVRATGRGAMHGMDNRTVLLDGLPIMARVDLRLDHADYDDLYGYRIVTPPETWYVRGTTPDGRRFAVQTQSCTDDRVRLFLTLGTLEPALLGFTDAAAPLAVQVRLPDGQGVVVAAGDGDTGYPAALRYRVARGAWLPVAKDAALLPAAATEVEVTVRGGRPVRIPLP